MSLTQGFISLRIEVHNMPNTTSTYEPLVLVDTADLPEEEWLEYRRRGIGGSDAAAILGVSPFATARDLYYDKLKVVSYSMRSSVRKKAASLPTMQSASMRPTSTFSTARIFSLSSARHRKMPLT